MMFSIPFSTLMMIIHYYPLERDERKIRISKPRSTPKKNSIMSREACDSIILSLGEERREDWCNRGLVERRDWWNGERDGTDCVGERER